MNNNDQTQNIEYLLGEELSKLKRAVEYIEDAKSTVSESVELLKNIEHDKEEIKQIRNEIYQKFENQTNQFLVDFQSRLVDNEKKLGEKVSTLEKEFQNRSRNEVDNTLKVAILEKRIKNLRRNNLIMILIVMSVFVISAFQIDFYHPAKGIDTKSYQYDGFIQTPKGKKLDIILELQLLNDSALIGSYSYLHQAGILEIKGGLLSDNTFSLVERDSAEKITGYFNGKFTSDKSKAIGDWTSPEKEEKLNFVLTLSER